MRVIVTGGAGFIGSTLTERLLDEGHRVTVIDCFTDYYDPAMKRANLAAVADHPNLTVSEIDLATDDLVPAIDGADVIWHLAGQPGVRLSWSDGFARYESCNVLATQRLLEAARTTEVGRFMYASSSSVYGNAERYPTLESDRPEPFSPYGVTKLAAEHLCGLYAANWGVPFTYVDDVVDATHRAGLTPDVDPGTVLNVSGSEFVTLGRLIDLVGDAVGQPVPIDRQPAQAGDAAKTGGSTDRIAEVLGWSAKTSLADGIAAQVRWHRNRRG